MPVSLETFWWGFKLYFSLEEACWLARGYSVAATVLKALPYWVTYIAGWIVTAYSWLIKDRAQHSGGKGIVIWVTWNGYPIGIYSRGSGYSPCPPIISL